MADESPSGGKGQPASPPNVLGAVTAILVVTGAASISAIIRSPELAIISILLGLLSAWPAIVDKLTKKSKLEDSKAFVLEPSNSEHLKLREEDVKKLRDRFEDHAVVVLQAPSGTGKSALVLGGLCPTLAAESGLLPVVVDHYADRSENGLRSVLVEALGGGADPGPGDGHATDKDRIGPLVAKLAEAHKLRPLLVFDQLDDYLVGRASLDPQSSVEVAAGDSSLPRFSPQELTVWREVFQLVSRRKVKCLLVIHPDFSGAVVAALSNANLKPNLFTLMPLGDRIHQALVEVTSVPGAVRNPDRGWEQLRERLARDLEQNGGLPGEMAIALRSLRRLSALTPSRYRQAGWLAGLEKLHVSAAIQQARGPLSQLQVTRLLFQFFDTGAHLHDLSPFLLTPRTAAEAAQRADITPAGLALSALQSLEESGIVKQRQDGTWGLYHEFLCRPIAELDVLKKPGSALLAHYEDFRQAQSIWRRWESLLPIGSQLSSLWSRLRGKQRYGEASRYALLSLLRFIPLAVLLLALIGLLRSGLHYHHHGILTAWELPPDLYERQKQLTTLGLPGNVNDLGWVSRHVQKLAIDHSSLVTVSGLPGHLRELSLTNDSELRVLPALPSSVVGLDLTGDQRLAAVVAWPPKLRRLAVAGTSLSDFAGLPPDLLELTIGSDALIALGQLPRTLQKLSRLTVLDSRISDLGGLPPKLDYLELRRNKLEVYGAVPGKGPTELRIEPLNAQFMPSKVSAQVDLSRLPRGLHALELSQVFLPDLTGLPSVTHLTLAGVSLDSWAGLPSSVTGLALTTTRPPEALPRTLHSLELVGTGKVDAEALRPLAGLTDLRVGLAPLENIAALPGTVRSLVLESTGITNLDNVPGSVTTLIVRGAPDLTAVQHLPPKLQRLDLEGCSHLSQLEGLGEGLLALRVAGTALSGLPRLPRSLRSLDLSNTCISDLHGLPDGLTSLTLSPGRIKSLRELPESVRELRFLPQGRLDCTPLGGGS